jgi:hypothetical protein
MTTFDAAGGSFDFGRVVQRTFTVIGANLALFGTSALLLVTLPFFAANLIGYIYRIQWVIGLSAFVGGLIAGIGGVVLQGVVVHSAVGKLNGRRVEAGDALNVGLRALLPLIGLGIVQGLAIAIGIVLLVVPGLILMTIWSIAAPALVIEKRGGSASLERSRQLTRGHRWSIFGLLVIYFILSMILSVVVQALSLTTGVTTIASGSLSASTAMAPAALVALFISALTAGLQGVLGAAGAASIYYELRTTKEGVAPDQLASVFD